jgi:hypothetical protein
MNRRQHRQSLALLTLLLVLLGACAPAVRFLPPETPIVYDVPYDTLFDATLQELTAAYTSAGTARRTFSIEEADRDTGLIRAVRREPTTRANVRYRSPDTNPRFGFSLLVPLPITPAEETTITVVVRPEGEGASLIYSTQGPDGRISRDAEAVMQRVITRLDERFGSEAGLVVRQRQLP